VPMKTRGAHRQYRRRDVEIALHIKDMLQDEGLTLSGVKKRLREETRSAPNAQKPAVASIEVHRDGEVRLRAVLVELRAELVQLAARLAPELRDEVDEVDAAEGDDFDEHELDEHPREERPSHEHPRDEHRSHENTSDENRIHEAQALVFADAPSRHRER